MGLSPSQEFLVHACRATGSGEYFRWTGVGSSLGLDELVSANLVQALDQQRLVRLLSNGNARVLEAGRRRARELETRLRARA